MDKINYFLKGEEIIKSFNGRKPKLLMHTCCAPCACYPLTYLIKYFDLTLYFFNSNIYPETEFNLRKEELKDFVIKFNKDYNADVKVIYVPYDHTKYMESLIPLKDEPERGKRCLLCYEKRIRSTFEYAFNNNFEFVTTVMSISRQKDSQILNQIGIKVNKDYPNINYFLSDFKKNNGILIGQNIRDKYNLYQQNYCGCEYSIRKENISKKTNYK